MFPAQIHFLIVLSEGPGSEGNVFVPPLKNTFFLIVLSEGNDVHTWYVKTGDAKPKVSLVTLFIHD